MAESGRAAGPRHVPIRKAAGSDKAGWGKKAAVVASGVELVGKE